MIHWTEVLFNADDNKLKTNLLKNCAPLQLEIQLSLLKNQIHTENPNNCSIAEN